MANLHRHRARQLAILVSVVAASLGLAGCFTVNVEKVVSGTQPSGAEYTVSVSCTGDSGSANFSGPGTASGVVMEIGVAPSTCTVTENPDGGASSVTIECFEESAPSTNICT